MAGLSLREAAQETGTSKSTILRAIQAGRLSASRTDDGGYAIDPAELFRVYDPNRRNATQQTAHRTKGQDAPPADDDATPTLKIQNAQLKAELEAARKLLEAEGRRGEELREDRDRWHAQAERLSLTGPSTSPASSSGLAAFIRSLLPHRTG
jgi:excisionase family DNA binding protein